MDINLKSLHDLQVFYGVYSIHSYASASEYPNSTHSSGYPGPHVFWFADIQSGASPREVEMEYFPSQSHLEALKVFDIVQINLN